MKMIAGAFFSAYEYAARARSPKTTTLLHPCAHLLECLAQVRLRLASHLRGGVTHAAERSATAALAHLGHDLRPIDEEEERSGFVRHGTRDERLARPWQRGTGLKSPYEAPSHKRARAHTTHTYAYVHTTTHTCIPQRARRANLAGRRAARRAAASHRACNGAHNNTHASCPLRATAPLVRATAHTS